MTSSSKKPPLPPGSSAGADPARQANYARFIPREELHSFSAWEPSVFTDEAAHNASAGHGESTSTTGIPRNATAGRRAPPPPPAAPPPPPLEEQLKTARTQGYNDGYRDGLAALDAFKQQWAAQTSQQVGAVIDTLQGEFAHLEQLLADRLAGVAIALARQVVRTEIAQSHETVIHVAQEALNTLLATASHIVIRLHPDDMALVMAGASDMLGSRNARLMADPQIERGGCVVESDLGVIDARLEQRWLRAVEAIGQTTPWDATEAAHQTDPAIPPDTEFYP